MLNADLYPGGKNHKCSIKNEKNARKLEIGKSCKFIQIFKVNDAQAPFVSYF